MIFPLFFQYPGLKHRQIEQVKLSSGLLVARLAQSVEHGTLNIIRSGIPGSWVRAPRWAKLDLIFPLFFQYPDLKHRQIEQVKMSTRLLVDRLAQSVEHGTLNIIRSGIPGSWVRAPRWAKLDLIFPLFFQYPDLKHRQIEQVKLNSGLLVARLAQSIEHGTLNVIRSGIPGSCVRAPRWAKLDLIFPLFFQYPGLKHRQIEQVKMNSGLLVARLAQSVEHGTLNVIRSGIPGSLVRAPRWAKLDLIFPLFFQYPGLKHRQIEQVKLSSGLLVARLAQSVEHGTLNVIRSGIPGSWVRAPRWAKLDLIFPLFFQYPDLKHRQIEQVKLSSGLLVARLAQSVEHGTLNVIRSGIPGSWVRAPRWAKLDLIFPLFFQYPDLKHRQIEQVKLSSGLLVARLAQSVEHGTLNVIRSGITGSLGEARFDFSSLFPISWFITQTN